MSLTKVTYSMIEGATVNVQDYGAVGDGVADDAAAIQAAIDATGNNASIYFPSGVYAIGAAGLDIDGKTAFTLFGDGAKIKITAISVLQNAYGAATTIRFINCVQSGIKNLEIDGNAIATTAVDLTSCTECFIVGNTIYNCGVSSQISSGGGGLRNRVENNLVHSSIGTARGIWLGNTNAGNMETGLYVAGNTCRDNSYSGIVVSAFGAQVIGNYLIGNDGAGIVIPANVGGFETSDVLVSNNYCEDNLFQGIQSDCITGSVSRNCTITGNVCIKNNRSTGTGIYVLRVDNWTVSNNVCNDNGSAGIYIDAATNVSVTGNICNETRSGGSREQLYGVAVIAQTDDVSTISISGNVCHNNVNSGVRVENVGALTIQNVAITGNACTQNSDGGIFVTEVAVGNLANIIVDGNVCASNAVQDLRLTLQDVVVGNNKYATSLLADFYDFTDGDTSPSVAGRSYWRAVNTTPTSITAFDNGFNGQAITIRATSANTTIVNSASLINKGGTNVTVPTNGIISYVRQGSVWYETSRSF